MNPHRRPLPERAAAVAALAGALLLPALFAVRQVGNLDTGFHLKAGGLMLDGRGWPRLDTFTFTVNDHPYVDTSWGYQVLLASVERAAGAPGIVILHAALVAATFAVLLLTSRIGRAGPAVTAPLLILAAVAAEPRFEARPELLSFLLLALLLLVLQRRAEGLPAPLPLLPPLMLLWANCHGLFILGWGVMACFVAGQSLRDRRPDRRLLLWSAAAVAACFVNPYGWRGPAAAFALATRMRPDNVFGRSIGEFTPTLAPLLSDEVRFFLPSILCFLALAALVAASVGPLRRQGRYASVGLVLIFLPLSLTMARNVPLLAIACLPGAAWALGGRRGPARGFASASGAARARTAGLALCGAFCVLAAARIVTSAYYVDRWREERFGLGWNRLTLPVDAAAWADRVGLRGPVLNHLNFGGYLMWARPDPVFIDGRLEVMGERFFEEYRRILASPAGLEEGMRRWGFRWIVFPHAERPDLVAGLSADPSWRLAYVDHLAAAFVPAGAGSERLIDSSAATAAAATGAPSDLGDLPGLGGRKIPGGLRRRLGGLLSRREFPAADFMLGVFHYHRGEHGPAARRFAAAIRESGGEFPDMYDFLGRALLALNRPEEARACFRVFLSELAPYRRARREEALRLLERTEHARGGPFTSRAGESIVERRGGPDGAGGEDGRAT